MRKRTSGKVLGIKWSGAAALAAMLLGGVAPEVAAADKKKAAEPYGVIAGTVFRETGFSFAGVEIVVVWELEGKKKKEWKARTDARGEFAFRIPAAAGRYTVRVKADGYAPEERVVEIGLDERRDLSIQLKTETVTK